jgi:hypothetical protein
MNQPRSISWPGWTLLAALLCLVALQAQAQARRPPRRPLVLLTGELLPPAPVAQLLSQLGQTAFIEDKLALLRDAVRAGLRLSCADIAQAMRTTAFADDQVEIAALLYPRALDPENVAALLAVLPFPADQRALRTLLGR